MSETAELKLDGKSIQLPVLEGTENEKAIDIYCVLLIYMYFLPATVLLLSFVVSLTSRFCSLAGNLHSS